MFHRVVRGHNPLWEPLYNNFVVSTPYQYITSTYRPGSGTAYGALNNDGTFEVPKSKWAKVITGPERDSIIGNDDGKIIAWMQNNLDRIFDPNQEGAQYLLFDELKSDNLDFYRRFFGILRRSAYSVYAPRVGVYIVWGLNVSYKNLAPAIDEILRANSLLCPELYSRHSDYCQIKNQNSISGAGDIWMRQSFTENKLDYLISRRTALKSGSFISPVIAVTDSYLDLQISSDAIDAPVDSRALAGQMIDRIFYNIGKTNYRSVISTASGSRGGIGTYKWTIDAFGINIGDNSQSWNQLLTSNDGNPIEYDPPLQEALNEAIANSHSRISYFIRAWNAYCNLPRTQQFNPINAMPFCGDSTQLKTGSYHYPIYNEERAGYTQKPAPKDTELIIKGPNNYLVGKKSFLRKLNYSSKDIYGHNRVNGPTDLGYINAQRGEKFDLWVTEANTGYGMKGVNATSRYFKKFYPQSYEQKNIVVNGVCVDEAEYNHLASFIREQQVDVTTDHNNLLYLEIPPAGVKAVGVISSFVGGVTTENTGVMVAPTFTFEFFIIKNLNDQFDNNLLNNYGFSKTLKVNQQNKLILNTGDYSVSRMFSIEGNNQTITQTVPSTKPKPSKNKGAKGGVKNGAKNTRGKGR